MGNKSTEQENLDVRVQKVLKKLKKEPTEKLIILWQRNTDTLVGILCHYVLLERLPRS